MNPSPEQMGNLGQTIQEAVLTPLVGGFEATMRPIADHLLQAEQPNLGIALIPIGIAMSLFVAGFYHRYTKEEEKEEKILNSWVAFTVLIISLGINNLLPEKIPLDNLGTVEVLLIFLKFISGVAVPSWQLGFIGGGVLKRTPEHTD